MTIRSLFVIWCTITMVGILGCSPNGNKSTNMQPLLDKLSHGPESELPELVFGYRQSSTGAQQVLLRMLRPLRAPSPQQHMTVEAVRQSGRFTMIVANVPWPRGSEPAGLHPIIVTGDIGKEQVVGYVLPFDDILPLVRSEDMQSVAELSQWWIQEYAQKSHR